MTITRDGCQWAQDGEDSDIWASKCGYYFIINEDWPSYNNMRFCCFCGRPLVESPHGYDAAIAAKGE